MEIMISRGGFERKWYPPRRAKELRRLYAEAATASDSDIEGIGPSRDSAHAISALERDEANSELKLPLIARLNGKYCIQLREREGESALSHPGTALECRLVDSAYHMPRSEWITYGKILETEKQWAGTGEPQEALYSTIGWAISILRPHLKCRIFYEQKK